MATPTTTTVTTTTRCASFGPESGHGVGLRQVYSAWSQCRRRKRHRSQAQRYELHLLDNLVSTQQALQYGQWVPRPPVCFTVSRPKARQIHAAHFYDRVIHHYLVPQLEAIWEPIFIHDLYSNRRGKGTHHGVERLQSWLLQLWQKQRPLYYLQCDVVNFFNSIDKPRLFALCQHRLRKALRSQQLDLPQALHLRDLLHRLLRQDVATEAIAIGRHHALPRHKQLGAQGAHKGLPIGNLTSQFLANVYLNELDQCVKHHLKARYYLRFVDDFVLLHHDAAQLAVWHEEIVRFLAERLQLALKPTSLRQVDEGIDFLGYIVRPHYKLVRKRVVNHLAEKLDAWRRRLWHGSVRRGWHLVVEVAQLEMLRALLASYWGHFSHADSYHLRQRILQHHPWLTLLFVEHHGQLHAAWQPASVTSLRSQIRYFHRRFPAARLNIHAGYQIHAIDPRHRSPADPWRMRVESVTVVEAGYLAGGMKRRLLHRLTLTPGAPPWQES
jgi:RNA-directed DNA polymerase